MHPFLPEPEAIEVAKAAFEILRSEFPDFNISSRRGRHKLSADARLQHAATTYWLERRIYNRKSPTEFNEELDKIRNASVNLRHTLSNAPPFVRGALDDRLKLRLVLQTQVQVCTKSQVEKIETVLKQLATDCQGLKEPTRRGARPKRHIANAVADLVELWSRAGKVFEWRFDRAKGDGRRTEFVSKGAQFVWRLMSAIDPDLEIGEVSKALKELSLRQKAMSNNSRST
jgi:hypothetical protein